MSWFQQGYEKVDERQSEIDQAMKSGVPSLFIKPEDEDIYVSFITPEPITYYEHFLKHLKRSFTCPDNGDASKGTCPLCSMGNKPSFKGAYLVIDHRHEKWEKDGTVHERQHTLKVFKQGIRVLNTLKKTNAKLIKGSQIQAPIPEGILGLPFEIVRSGSGTDTAYTFNPIQPNPEFFPRNYELPEKMNEQETIIDHIQPLSTQKLLEVVGGGTTQQAPPTPYGNQAQFQGGQPQAYGQQPQGQVYNQQPQGQPMGQPLGQPLGQAPGSNPFQTAQNNMAQQGQPGSNPFQTGQPSTPLDDDADVISFPTE